jgi:hypothetical protein
MGGAMEDVKKQPVTPAAKQPYEAPAISFEHPTEALAGVCNNTTNCPSKQSSGQCDSFEPCQSLSS